MSLAPSTTCTLTFGYTTRAEGNLESIQVNGSVFSPTTGASAAYRAVGRTVEQAAT